jgi:glucan phosphoethanolaminetransferase (alkaline phosphatase superfamily)
MRRILHRVGSGSCTFSLWLASLLNPIAAQAADRPNVILVVIDTLRADHLGVYGYSRPTSPRLDGLAAKHTKR